MKQWGRRRQAMFATFYYNTRIDFFGLPSSMPSRISQDIPSRRPSVLQYRVNLGVIFSVSSQSSGLAERPAK